MLFVFDENKNLSNIEKHKVSFEEAQTIWEDSDLLIAPARERGEKRCLAIGRAYSAVFSVVHTQRGESIRIISARRSTKKEVRLYEQGRTHR